LVEVGFADNATDAKILSTKKDEIALEVQKQVAEEMSTYGYIIVKTLITKVEPDAEVKQFSQFLSCHSLTLGSINFVH